MIKGRHNFGLSHCSLCDGLDALHYEYRGVLGWPILSLNVISKKS